MQPKAPLKIMTILGTRPEIIRLSRILPELDAHVDHCIVFTRQSFNQEMSDIFFEELGLRKPDYILDVKAETLGKQIANIIKQSEEVMQKVKPDALLILGDTNSSLSAIIAKRLKIPIFHMEAGNRSFDWDVPEEVNRRIVDHISDINLAYTEHARRYLLAEGIHPGLVYVVGSPYAEIFAHFSKNIDKTDILSALKLKRKKYFLVSCHREENVEQEERLKRLFLSLSALAKQYQLPVVISLHPRTAKKIESLGPLPPLLKFHKPFGFFEFAKLEKESLCVLSDSGTIQEESALLGFPAVQIRVSNERPEAFDAGSIILTGFEKDTILHAVSMVVEDKKSGIVNVIPSDYLDRNVSKKVVRLIVGLTSIKKFDLSKNEYKHDSHTIHK
jgi:UDP-N-acetylglucosamine 2-epimerase (non-hydrolysing)